MNTSGTKADYTVDIWSGNHPFFQGSNATLMLDEGRVNRFNRRFEGIHFGQCSNHVLAQSFASLCSKRKEPSLPFSNLMRAYVPGSSLNCCFIAAVSVVICYGTAGPLVPLYICSVSCYSTVAVYCLLQYICRLLLRERSVITLLQGWQALGAK